METPGSECEDTGGMLPARGVAMRSERFIQKTSSNSVAAPTDEDMRDVEEF